MVIRGGALANLSKPGDRILGYATSMNANTLLADTNAQRIKYGDKPLQLSRQLDAAAEAKARNMAQLDYWSHNTPSGQPPWIFVTEQHYQYQVLGENLATGFSNEKSVINAWMASKGHRENILNDNYTQVGFGTAQTANYKSVGGGPMTIIVAFYAAPSPKVTTAVRPIGFSRPDTLPIAKTSHAQLALAGMSMASAGTTLSLIIIAIAVTAIITRHLLGFRRALRRGEKFIGRHPLLDACFVMIIILAYVMSQTAGLIG